MDILNSTNYDYRANTVSQTQVSAESKASQTKPDYSVHGAAPTASPAASSSGAVTLPENTSEAVASSADQMIMKALTASGLPASDRNRTLIMELLQHKLPVDKQTLQMFAKLAASNRNASSLTLILLYKNQIPITPANIRQFDAYQNGSHQLLKDIQSLSKSILELMKTLLKVEPGAASGAGAPNSTAPASGTESSGNQAAAVTTGHSNPDNTATATGPSNSDGAASASGLSGSASTAMPASLSGSDTAASPMGLINSDGAASASALSGSASTAMAASLAGSDASAVSTGFTNPDGTATIVSLANSDSAATASGLTGLDSTAMPAYFSGSATSAATIGHTDLGGIATTSGQTSLDATATAASSPPLAITPDQTQQLFASDPQAMNMLLSPDAKTQSPITASDVLKWLTDALASSPDQKPGLLPEGTLPELSNEFFSKIEQLLRQKWTLTPEQLAGKKSLKELYEKLENDLHRLDELIRFQKETTEVLQAKEPVRNLQDNLQFMKDLSHLFSYIQLPLRLTDREVHGEFYVFNKKNALQGKKDILSVLLHLDMAELGAINIHMKLERNQIQATFAVEAPEAVSLIKDHLPELTSSLTRKGYQLQARVEKQEHPQALMKEFLEQDPSGNALKTFSFDIRA